MQIQFKGVQAVIILVVAVGFFGFRIVTARDALTDETRDRLTEWLQARYTAEYLAGMDMSNPTSADADSLLARANVEIVSMEARGRLDDTVVRTEILVNGQPPPDGEPVRYWRMEYSRIAGWRLRRETNALGYYLAVF